MNPTTDPYTLPSSTVIRTWPKRRVLRLLQQEEGSLRLMAGRLGVSFGHLANVMRGVETSARLAAEIALTVSSAVGRVVRPCDIWPRLYAEDGGPLSTAARRMSKAS